MVGAIISVGFFLFHKTESDTFPPHVADLWADFILCNIKFEVNFKPSFK